MGNRNNRTLFYVGTSIAALLLLMFWATPKAIGKQSKWSTWTKFMQQDGEAEPHVTVSALEGSARKGLRFKKKSGDNDVYQASKNYVNSYTPSTEFQHPLIASTKFISKKDQKKKKNSKKKQLQAKNKMDASRSKRQFGFSEEMEDDSSGALPTTVSQVAPQNAKTQNNTNTTKKEQEEQENLNSFEYWETPIFVDENASMVSKLIESFQGRKVSNGVFYDLVTEMRQDERAQVREFGLTALSATPSVQSFAQLSLMKHSDPEASLRTAAGQEVASYYLEQRLSHVVNALKLNVSDTNRATYEALVVLNDATVKYSQAETPTPTRSSSSSVEPRFEQALTVIDQAGLTESADTKIKTQAVKTSASLTEFLAR